MSLSMYRRARDITAVTVAAMAALVSGNPALAGTRTVGGHQPAVSAAQAGPGGWVVAFGQGMHGVHIPAAGTAATTAFGVGWTAGGAAHILSAGSTAGSHARASDSAAPWAADGLRPHVTLTLSAIGRNGRPADIHGLIFNTASKSGDSRRVSTPGGTGKIRLPAGTYLIDAGVLSGQSRHQVFTEMFLPLRLTRGHTHLILDARRAEPVTLTLDGRTPAAGQFAAVAYLSSKFHWAEFLPGAPGSLDVMAVRDSHVRFSVQWDIYRSGQAGTRQYALAAADAAGVPARPSYHFTTAALAAVTDTYRSQDASTTGAGTWAPELPGMAFSAIFQHPAALPRTITHYLMPHTAYFGVSDTGNPSAPEEMVTTMRKFGVGNYAQTWNGAAIGPRGAAHGATRTGNTFTYHTVGFFSDDVSSHLGLDYAATGTITLTRNGKLVGSAPFQHSYPNPGHLTAQLPSAPARYTLRVSASRTGPHTAISTQVTAAWSFRSEHAAATTALPLITVRFQIPGLNSHNQAKAGTVLHIPLWVDRQPGAVPVPVTRLTVQVSADGGRSWQPVVLSRACGHWVATVRNLATPGYMAVRATVADNAGDRVTQTILRAYAVTRL
ncbi:MAG TPA: hypothetical protein VGS19_37645 [Streptosporangiaceae bacterium]|nr:hypothetical protein [Streptosporangiaceae bacterium]